MTAAILRIPNEPHMARVREARRAAGLWLPSGFPGASVASPAPRLSQLRVVEADAELTVEGR